MLHKVAQSFYNSQTKKLSSKGWALLNEVATTIDVLDFETSIPN